MQVNFWLVRAESKGFVQAEVIFVWKRIIAGGGGEGGRGEEDYKNVASLWVMSDEL